MEATELDGYLWLNRKSTNIFDMAESIEAKSRMTQYKRREFERIIVSKRETYTSSYTDQWSQCTLEGRQ